MSRAFVIAVVAAWAYGCGNGAAPRAPESTRVASDSPSGSSDSANSAQGQRATTSTDPSVPATSGPPLDQRVSVTGCLTGGEAVATTARGSSATGTSAVAGGPDNGAGPNLFVVTHAKPDVGGAGMGANGAGASGGPLLSGVAEYRLDGNPTELRSHLNQHVRIFARLDPRQSVTSGTVPSGRSDVATPSAGNANGHIERPSGSSSGEDGSRSAASAASVARLLVVESIQMVAPNCAGE
jgi:hypothetical protein